MMRKYNIEDESPESGLEQFCLEFAQDRIEELSALKASFDSKDYTVLHELTHRWIGFSGPYGFNWLAKASRKLKEQVKEGKIEESLHTLQLIEKYLLEKKEYLKDK